MSGIRYPQAEAGYYAGVYIRTLRNEAKRRYAYAYFRSMYFLGPEPERGELSAKAAQAVGAKLHKIRDDYDPKP